MDGDDSDSGDGEENDDGQDPDNDSIEATREDVWGNPMSKVGDKWVTEFEDFTGQKVFVDDDRKVVMTERPGGDVYMENTGETFTPMIDPTGLEALHGSAGGGMITERTDVTDNTGYTYDQPREDTGGRQGSADTPDVGSSHVGEPIGDSDGGAEGEGAYGGADGRLVDAAGQTTQRRRRAPVQTVSPAADPYYRRRKYKEGFGYFFVYFFFFFEMAAIFGSSWLYYTQHFSLGMSHLEAVFGVFLVTGMIYLINALLWLVSGRLFLFFDMKKADLFAWIVSVIMIVTPAIIVLVMLFAG